MRAKFDPISFCFLAFVILVLWVHGARSERGAIQIHASNKNGEGITNIDLQVLMERRLRGHSAVGYRKFQSGMKDPSFSCILNRCFDVSSRTLLGPHPLDKSKHSSFIDTVPGGPDPIHNKKHHASIGAVPAGPDPMDAYQSFVDAVPGGPDPIHNSRHHNFVEPIHNKKHQASIHASIGALPGGPDPMDAYHSFVDAMPGGPDPIHNSRHHNFVDAVPGGPDPIHNSKHHVPP